MSDARIWLWRKSVDNEVEILLQQRSFGRSSSPGKFSISAAGHINDGESVLQAAIRETKEEIV